MDLYLAMRAFARVVESNSFSAAARQSGHSQSLISKQIAALEAHLGARLLNRSTRRITLTNEGERYLPYCRQILEIAESAETDIGKNRGLPSGLVRIGSPSAFARHFLARQMAELLKRWPQLKIELIATDAGGSLVGQQIDVAIRFGDLEDKSLIGRRIGVTRRIAVATNEYLSAFGRPKTPEDLKQHNCLVYTHLATRNIWHFRGAKGPIAIPVDGNFTSNSSEAIREAALGHIGIAVMPDWLFRSEITRRKIEIILPNFEAEPLPIHIVYPSRRFIPQRIRAVVDFLEHNLGRDPTLRGPVRANFRR